jgi:hypothetical protein
MCSIDSSTRDVLCALDSCKHKIAGVCFGFSARELRIGLVWCMGPGVDVWWCGRKQVVKYLIDESRRGRTPNPDIMCNSRIKVAG